MVRLLAAILAGVALAALGHAVAPARLDHDRGPRQDVRTCSVDPQHVESLGAPRVSGSERPHTERNDVVTRRTAPDAGERKVTPTAPMGKIHDTPRTRNALNATRSAGHRALRAFVSRRDGNMCAWCRAAEWLEFDHVISVRCGGAHHPENLRVLCGPCNATKGAVVDAQREAVA